MSTKIPKTSWDIFTYLSRKTRIIQIGPLEVCTGGGVTCRVDTIASLPVQVYIYSFDIGKETFIFIDEFEKHDIENKCFWILKSFIKMLWIVNWDWLYAECLRPQLLTIAGFLIYTHPCFYSPHTWQICLNKVFFILYWNNCLIED